MRVWRGTGKIQRERDRERERERERRFRDLGCCALSLRRWNGADGRSCAARSCPPRGWSDILGVLGAATWGGLARAVRSRALSKDLPYSQGEMHLQPSLSHFLLFPFSSSLYSCLPLLFSYVCPPLLASLFSSNISSSFCYYLFLFCCSLLFYFLFYFSSLLFLFSFYSFSHFPFLFSSSVLLKYRSNYLGYFLPCLCDGGILSPPERRVWNWHRRHLTELRMAFEAVNQI